MFINRDSGVLLPALVAEQEAWRQFAVLNGLHLICRS